jgi:hypothetical protein
LTTRIPSHDGFVIVWREKTATIDRERRELRTSEGAARMTVRTAAAVFGLVSALAAGSVSCGSDAGSNAGKPGRDGGSAGDEDAGFADAKPSDPCLTAGYHFDGKSDCDVVRCPELSCECPANGTTTAANTLTLHACVRGEGCVDRVDCKRICDPNAGLDQVACQQRLASAGASCSTDHDCVTGHCRAESVGKICVDMLGCGSDGHCSAGFACRFNPGSVDAKTGLPSSLGNCSDGMLDSVCYAAAQCKYASCDGNRCSGGRVDDACESNANCASGFCRKLNTSTGGGSCVSGERGGSCADDGDCSSGLHCTSGACFSSTVGQECDAPADCASGICVSSLCRGGEPGSVCLEDAHCKTGVCANGQCASGGLFSPCSDATDCKAGLRCARQVCTDGSAGSPCSSDADCTVLACVRGTCSSGANGDTCDAPDDCQSQLCADPAGVEPGECTSGAKGSPCIYAQNCLSASCTPQGLCN